MRRVLHFAVIGLGCLLSAAVSLFVIGFFTGELETYPIASAAMERTLHCGGQRPICEARVSDRVLANRLVYRLRDPRRGEIVVFRAPPDALVMCGVRGTFVQRVIGLPGDTVAIGLRTGLGYIYVNGRPLDEPYVEEARRAAVDDFDTVKVKPGTYFLLGDNRSQSCDSRLWGTVPRDDVIAKVAGTYWPPYRISLH